jgi:hypothetical protein
LAFVRVLFLFDIQFMKYQEIADLLEEIYQVINADTKMPEGIYESVEELEDDVLNYLDEMLDNSGEWIAYLDMHFEKDGIFEALDALNNWNLFDTWKSRYENARKS